MRGRVLQATPQALGPAGIDLLSSINVLLLHDQIEESDADRTRQREGWRAGGKLPASRHLNEVTVDGTGEPDRQEDAMRPVRRRR